MLEHVEARIQTMQYRATTAAATQRHPVVEDDGHCTEEFLSPEIVHLQARVLELEAEREGAEREFQGRLEMVRQQAFESGRQSRENEQAGRISEAVKALEKAIEEFRIQREHYLADVEQEVVRLALAIAERILHREAQMDPLLLTGAVRVALGQLAENTEVRLRVPSAERELWVEMLRLMPTLPLRPDVIADDQMRAGDCTVETHLGNVDIGVRAQLAEIERGFFDLLEHRNRTATGLQVAGH